MRESAMRDDIDLKHFKQRLQARLEEITANRKSIDPVTLDQARIGRLSRMDAMQQQAMAQANERQRAGELIRIEAALSRLGDGDYGYCERCGEKSAPKRLEVDPAAALCIGCAERHI